MKAYAVRRTPAHWVVTYTAMAGPCEVLVDCDCADVAERLAAIAYAETVRIEYKYSRYREDSVVHAINHAGGAAVAVDEETSRLFAYAARCYELSDGLFDVTSGILRRAWTFDGGEVMPDTALIASLLECVGWHRVKFHGSVVELGVGMEIDLGGIGKEYAADRVAERVAEAGGGAVLVNLGGDIRVTGHGAARRTWTIGIEQPGHDDTAVGEVRLSEGGVATSGDSRRFCTVGGVRMGHVLDPRTGWPVAGAPRSATVVSDTCTAAGFLATLAMLHGPDAEVFLDAQGVVYHCIR
jgi:thiamine biosynthesis lipoprotein